MEAQQQENRLYCSDPGKKARGISQAFKDKKHAGSLEESMHAAIRDCERAGRQEGFKAQGYAERFGSALEDPARVFFFRVATDQISCQQMKGVMAREHDSAARQESAQTKLENLKLRDRMREEGIEDYERGLISLISRIERIVPQGPPNFRSDDNKLRHLRSAAAEMRWAGAPITGISARRRNFNSFSAALRSCLQVDRERKERNCFKIVF